ncbi:heat shock family protein [Salix suchowensis]|nr:heat shock family protein [Salix suchowensis]
MEGRNTALVLLVYLPGFLREQVRVTAEEQIRYIRVNGERILSNNTRNRFNTAYSVPKNCDLSQMKAEFANGILTIRIPKNIPAATASQEDPGVQEFTGKPKPEKNGEENPSGTTSATLPKKQKGKMLKLKAPKKQPAKPYLKRVKMKVLKKLIYWPIPQNRLRRRVQGRWRKG